MMKILIPIIISVFLISCHGNDQLKGAAGSEENESLTPITDTIRVEQEVLLQEQLDARKAQWKQSAPEEVQNWYQENQTAIEQSGILGLAVQKGAQAPNFTLKNAVGEDVSLYSKLKEGPVILTWYRGGWCPFCNITLSYMQESIDKFRKKGAQVIAITPELPDSSLSTKEKHALEFEVLSDVGNVVAQQYGIVYTLKPEVANILQKKFDIYAYNGDESNQLPLAANYIIDQNGTVQYAFLDAEYRNRAEPKEMLKVLAKL